ncbi:MAG: Ig-like domain-containing protein, partial [Planctomycetota bacterium]
MPDVQIHRLIYRALEPRVVFDGAAAATMDVATEPATPADAETAASEAETSQAESSALYEALAGRSHEQGDPSFAPDGSVGADPIGSEFVFIDSSVEDVDTLIAGLNPSANIVMLDSESDGVWQIVNALRNESDVSAIHILAHGDNGELALGNAVVDVEGLRQSYADEFAVIGEALTDKADILIYGCNFSGGAAGAEAVELLGQMTGADIAASSDLTGSSGQGGDWNLETQHGAIEAQAISVEAWGGVLDLPPVANDDTVTATEDSRTIFNPLANDSDAEGDVFLTSFGQPGSGEVTIAMGETGSVEVDSGGTTISLDRNYENPVVFVFTTTENESSSSPDIARVSNITGNSFDLAIVEPNSGNPFDTTDGVHGLETVSYIVLEAGVWTLGDGTVVEVGTRDVATDAGSFTNVTFNHTFGSEPVVLSQVQTNNNTVDYNEARQRNVTGTGYQVTNEPADFQSSAIGVAERIGYLAVSAGAGTWSGIDFEAGITADNVTHVEQGISFASDLGSSVNFLGQLHSFDGPDNAHADASNLSGTGVRVSVQEDRTSDSEVNHTSERIGWLALGGDGLLGAVSGTGLRMASADVQFIYTTADDVFGSESFSYTVEDTIGQTASATVTVNATAETDVVADAATTIANTPVTVNVLDNDNFEGAVTLTAVSAPVNGAVSFNASGSVTYTPNPGFQGVETLTYTVTEDTLGLVETGAVSFTVTSNTAPSANADNIAASEDATTTFNPLANDSDAESDFFLTSFVQPTVGELQLDIGQVGSIDVNSVGTTINFGRSYTNPVVFAFVTTENETSSAPDIARVSNVTGTSFDLRIVEPNSGVGSDTTDGAHGVESVSYIVLEAGIWTLADGTVVEVGKSDVSTGANSFTNVNFTHTFSGTPVAISSIQTDNNGIEFNSARQNNVSGTGYQVTNEPADYQSNAITQAESIGYLVIGQGSGSWSGLNFEAGITADDVTHTDRAVSFSSSLGGAPNLLAQLHTFDGGDNAHLDANSLTASGVNFSVQEDRTLDSEINHTTERAGWLAIGGSGVLQATSGSDYRIASSDARFSYSAPDDVNGVQTFNYTIEDVHGNTDTGLATLNIAPEADTVADVATTAEETAVSFNVLANDAFEGSVVLSNVLPPANGSVTFDAAGNVTYTPNPDFNGVETITYVVSEDTLGVTETGTISVTVTPVNDPPIANDDFVVTDAGRPTPISVLANDTDVDMDSLVVVAASAANGTVSINANGTITYQSAPGFV